MLEGMPLWMQYVVVVGSFVVLMGGIFFICIKGK